MLWPPVSRPLSTENSAATQSAASGYAKERSPGLWLWTVTVTIRGPPFGDARTLDETKAQFKAAWLAFKDKHGAERLAQAYDEMKFANRNDL